VDKNSGDGAGMGTQSVGMERRRRPTLWDGVGMRTGTVGSLEGDKFLSHAAL